MYIHVLQDFDKLGACQTTAGLRWARRSLWDNFDVLEEESGGGLSVPSTAHFFHVTSSSPTWRHTTFGCRSLQPHSKAVSKKSSAFWHIENGIVSASPREWTRQEARCTPVALVFFRDSTYYVLNLSKLFYAKLCWIISSTAVGSRTTDPVSCMCVSLTGSSIGVTAVKNATNVTLLSKWRKWTLEFLLWAPQVPPRQELAYSGERYSTIILSVLDLFIYFDCLCCGSICL